MENKVYIGSLTSPSRVLGNGELLSAQAILSSALVGDELSIDEFFPTIYTQAYIVTHGYFIPEGSSGLRTADGRRFRLKVAPKDGFKPPLPYGTPLWWYADGVLMGKFYAWTLERQTRDTFSLTAVSAIGLLDRQEFLGGLYTGQTFDVVCADILGPSIPFEVTDALKTVKIYGWLRIQTRRQALHQLLISTGAIIEKTGEGELLFSVVNADFASDIPDERMYYGGRVEYNEAVNRVEVVEHQFLQVSNVEELTLFDNTDGSGAANSTLVKFQQAPVHSLQASEGLTIEESGVNYARVTGTGVLTGKAYVHTTHSVIAEAEGEENPTLEENSKTVDDVTLISVANSYNVAKRLLSYYSSARTIRADIVVQDEKPNRLVNFTDPFGGRESAFIGSMDINASSMLKASCELIAGYTPASSGNNFDHVELLTGEGDYEVPAGVTLIRAVIINPGEGGESGATGSEVTPNPATTQTVTDSEASAVTVYSRIPGSMEGGLGGERGHGGLGGKVYVVDIAVEPGQKIHFVCPPGGLGGKYAKNQGVVPGSSGSPTTFGPYSGDLGETMPYGYQDPLTGNFYAMPGEDGIAGGQGTSVTIDSKGHYEIQRHTITDGVNSWISGPINPSPQKEEGDGDYQLRYGYMLVRSGPSLGGGAAYGADGPEGLPTPSSPGSYIVRDGYARAQAQAGASGANAQGREPPAGIGHGGHGGHGGGGAGPGSPAALAQARVAKNVSGVSFRGWDFLSIEGLNSGLPGDGTNGTDGAPGGILVYY